MKKIISLILALMLVLCMGAAAFAEDNGGATGGEETPTETTSNKNPTFSKTYKLTNEGTTNPAETFTFTFEAEKVEETTTVQKSDMPKIDDVTVTFADGDATTTGLEKTITVDLKDTNWPNVGIYYYKVKEKAGNTAGVVYNSTIADLKVTVAYNADTKTYYTAFVTLNLNEKDENGNTKTKTAGFTNEYKAGSLEITKTVTGNMGDRDKSFDVTVTFTAPNAKTVNSKISYAIKGSTTSSTIVPSDWEDGKFKKTISLKHGQTMVFTNIPYDVTYTVQEEDYTTDANGKYDTPTYKLNDAEATTTSISNEKFDSATETVVITNNKGAEVDMGVSTDSLPYIVLLGVVALIGAAMIIKRRATND